MEITIVENCLHIKEVMEDGQNKRYSITPATPIDSILNDEVREVAMATFTDKVTNEYLAVTDANSIKVDMYVLEKIKLKTKGKLYPDTEYIVSFTKDDAMGMLQVKAAFELGLPDTIIEFSNGTKMPMIAEDFPAFAKWFVIERANFFKG